MELSIEFNRPSLGFAQAEELRQAINYFNNQNKSSRCLLKHPGNLSYFIATACDEIVIPPVSQLNLTGLRAELSFYGATLEKLGVKFDMMRIGDYKTAAETYTRSSSTEANSAQMNRLLNNLYFHFVNGISDGRELSVDSVKKIIDSGPFTSVDALKYDLVDKLSYELENDKMVQLLPTISIDNYKTDTLIVDRWYDLPKIGIVVAEGEVAYRKGGLLPFSSSTDVTPQTMTQAVKQVGQDENISSVIVRINSPGGDALAGDEVHHQFDKLAGQKTVAVSFGNVAASGGYYISTPAEFIAASNSTITGSIGIYGGKAELSGLHEKLAVGKELYQRGKYSAMMSTMRPFTVDERVKYFSQMKSMYKHFVSLVSESRNLLVDSVDQLGQGQVWTGDEALANGLVDFNGGIKDAVDSLAEQMGYEQYRIDVFPKKKSFFNLPLVGQFYKLGALFSSAKEVVTVLDESLFVDSPFYLTRLPFDIVIE